MDALDELADTLRERLLRADASADGDGDALPRIRALVDREAAMLDAAARDELARRVAELAWAGLRGLRG